MLIRTFDCQPQPWKNGGGITRELLTYPSDGEWQLRISVADITLDGAFSHFAGVERAFAVIEGAGVQLEFSRGMQTVTTKSEPLFFAGSDAPNCKLIDGATRDLNVMWRDGYSAKMSRAYAGSKPIVASRGFFSLQELALYWDQVPPPAAATSGAHMGWWIDFL
jgi:environmental stress-induced protein Ves